MKKNAKRKLTLKLGLSLVIAMTVACVLLFTFLFWYLERYDQVELYPPGSVEAFHERNYYKINPDTILAALDLGETNVFAPVTAPPEAPLSEQPIEWQQAEYLKIAKALHQFVWNEALNGWSLYSMHFDTVCHDNPRGLRRAEFAYFKTVPYDLLSKDYVMHGILVSTEYGEAMSAGSENFPQQLFEKWKSIDLSQVNTTAEDALRIAEENGGREARLSIRNNCTIQVRLSGDFGWRIFIWKNDSDSLIFSLDIDPYTGQIVK